MYSIKLARADDHAQSSIINTLRHRFSGFFAGRPRGLGYVVESDDAFNLFAALVFFRAVIELPFLPADEETAREFRVIARLYATLEPQE